MIYQYYQEIKDYNFSEDQILVFGCHELGKLTLDMHKRLYIILVQN